MTLNPETVRALDSLVRNSFQQSRDEYFRWLLASTLAVAIGVVMEGTEVLYNGWNQLRDSATGYGSHSKWIVVTALLGWLLIAGGVVGEFALESQVANFDALLQALDSASLAEARLEAARANERASANEREAARLNKLAIEEASMLARLEEVTATRLIDSKKREWLASRLKPFSASLADRARFLKLLSTDPETLRFTLIIQDVLDRASIKHVLLPPDTSDKRIDSGLMIVGPEADMKFIQAFSGGLYQQTKSVASPSWNLAKSEHITVYIGSKPPAALRDLLELPKISK